MARRQRDYVAEHAARNARAQERGFSSYAEERQFRSETKEERAATAEALGTRPNIGDPNAAMSYYERVLVPIATMEPGVITGNMRHQAVGAYVNLGYSQEEAIEMMRELYGDSGKEA